jgi:hypothetical protein
VGLQEVAADLVAFPDDDCAYPPGPLERENRSWISSTGRFTERVT